MGASEGFKGASERFEGGLSKVRKVLEKGFKRLEKFLRRLRRLITCASNRSLAPPILTCASQPTHLRPPPCLPQCHDLNSKSLFKLPLPLAFHNAMIYIRILYLNFPPYLPQCHDLKSNSLFKLPFPCHPLCHNLKSDSLFKLPPLAFHYGRI